MKALAYLGKVVRFGVFEVNLQTGEARKHGIRIKLPGQPYQILAMLLERPGEVITQQEIRRRLWPDGTFVEFEDSVHSAIKKLRHALGDSPENPRYVETLPRVGYRFIAPVESRAANEIPTDQQQAADNSMGNGQPAEPRYIQTPPKLGHRIVVPVGSESLPPPSQTLIQKEAVSAEEVQTPKERRVRLPLVQRRWAIPAAIAVVLVAVVGVYISWSRSRSPQLPSVRVMLAVLPLENLTGDSAQDYFTDGLTEEMISQLGRLDPKHLGLIARTSVMHYKHSPVAVEQIGRELGVQYVLEGSVRRDADKVRVSAQLIQVKDQTHLWAGQYDRDLKDLFSLQGEIARQISEEIETAFGDHKPVVLTQPSLSPQASEAYNLYLQGLYFWNKRTHKGFEEAISYFQQATAKDPNFARAYAGLADSYILKMEYTPSLQPELVQKGRAAALRALEIDPNLSEAHTAFALIVENFEWDWDTAGKEYRRAIELNPNYPTAHQWYAEHLMWLGHFDEALRESELARQLDPLSLIIAADRGAILYYSRQYDRAIEQFRYVQTMDPHFPRTGLILPAYVEKGMFAEALAELERQRNFYGDGPWVWAGLSFIHGRAGQREQARDALRKSQRSSQGLPASPEWIIKAYIVTGEKDKALAYMEKQCAQHSNLMAVLRVEPSFDPLRSDPRFQDLLHRVHLAP